jgi:hypothetical protein
MLFEASGEIGPFNGLGSWRLRHNTGNDAVSFPEIDDLAGL